MTEVIPNLFIGNWRDAERAAFDAAHNGSSMHIVTVAHDSPFVGNLHFKLVDGPGNDPEILRAAAESVSTAYKLGMRVLVHCHGGRSRSGAVIVLVVMSILGTGLCEAYDLVANKHEITRIHPYLSKIMLEL